jgi:two-component system OmpR family response regulator
MARAMQPQRLEAIFPEVLLVAPETQDREATADYLRQNGFVVRLAEHAAAMDEALRRGGVNLVLLDLAAPGEPGLSICRRLGQDGTTPVVVMTGSDSDVDRIVALELGADDCVSRPSNPRELVARMRAVLRRTSAAAAAVQAPGKDLVYAFLGFELDVVRRQLKSPTGAVVLLPPSELSLLTVFLQHPDEVLSRERLLELVRREDANILDRAIDTHVSRLRRKLAAHSQAELIATVYGAGYRCTAEVARL